MIHLPAMARGLVLALAGAAMILAGSLPAEARPRGEAEDRRRQRLKKPIYTEIHPQYRETDASALIRIGSPEALAERRRALTRLVFGTGEIPSGLVARVVARDLEDRHWSGLHSLARIDVLRHPMEHGLASMMYRLRSAEPCSRLVLYHEGHGEDFGARRDIIARILDSGYDVIALNMPVTGSNEPPLVELEGVGTILLDSHTWFEFLDRPLRFFLEPVAAAVNFALKGGEYEEVVMIGFSGGGWATTVYSAMDPRIRRSFPVAGSVPLYLRSSTPDRRERHPGDFEQLLPELIRTANYLEMYVMGASGEGRRQLQVINQFDHAVPFRGVKHRTYLPAVRQAVTRLGPGEFDVLLDTSVGPHAFHGEALERILEELRPGCRGAGEAGGVGGF